MKILVIGGAGFIGSALVKELMGQGHTVTVLDLRSHAGCRVIPGDVRDRDLVRGTTFGHEAIYYLAGYTNEAFLKNPGEGANLEVLGVTNATESALEAGARHFIYASSFLVYSGMNPERPVSEDTDVFSANINAFGAAKLLMEKVVEHKCRAVGIQWTCCRLGSTYGASSRCTNVVYDFLSRGTQHKPIEIWGAGRRKNQFTYVRDVAVGLASVLEHEEHVYNLCSPECITTRGIADILQRNYGFSVRYREELPEKGGGPYVDSQRAQEQLDWRVTSLEVGIDQVYRSMSGVKALAHGS